jgi:hypothetical protein
LLKAAGWSINDKRVERIWRREGLKVPARPPKRGRIWDGDGSCLRLRAEHRDHVWSYDFVEARTHEGRKFRMLNVVAAFTRECLAIRVARKLKGGGHHRCAVRPVHPARRARPYPLGQRSGVHRQIRVGLDYRRWRKDSLHRTRLIMRERIRRELQRSPER